MIQQLALNKNLLRSLVSKQFFAVVNTQFSVLVHILRNDNTKEYFSFPFINFISQSRIIHRSSYSYAPQQNRITEWNWQMFKVANIIFMYMKVPKYFEGYRSYCLFLINCMLSHVLGSLLINCILSLVLGGQKLYTLLYLSIDPFPLPLGYLALCVLIIQITLN